MPLTFEISNRGPEEYTIFRGGGLATGGVRIGTLKRKRGTAPCVGISPRTRHLTLDEMRQILDHHDTAPHGR